MLSWTSSCWYWLRRFWVALAIQIANLLQHHTILVCGFESLKEKLKINRDTLKWLVNGCAMRPDITFLVRKLQFVSNPGDVHWHAIERIMCSGRYHELWTDNYVRCPRVLEGYSDLNWISNADEMEATSRYVFTLGSGNVSWKSFKHTV